MILSTSVVSTEVTNVTVTSPTVALHTPVATVAFVSGESTIAATPHVDGKRNFTCVATPELAASVMFTSALLEFNTLSVKYLPAHPVLLALMIPVNARVVNLKVPLERVEPGVITIELSQAVVAVTP